ncbi:MAG: DsrE family protein [Methanomicrobiales archaeon]|nr:DsrE family protein [Methanomicrobiales archaeon]
MIRRYGSIHELPEAAGQPEKDLDYRIIFSISRPPGKQQEPSPGLLHMASTVNFLESGGVTDDHRHLAGIVHGQATPAALSERAYWRIFGEGSPNADLIRDLTEHGVRICVCGQSFFNSGFQKHDLHRDVTLALSTLTVLPACQLKGYALMIY